MKDTEKKLEYVRLRASGKSYSFIAKELGISKSTCSSWEKELKTDIETLRQDSLQELYTSYNMTREARITKLGKALESIDEALAQKDLAELPADKLLELKLKYERERKTEYTEPLADAGADTVKGLLEQYNKLYTASQSGQYSPAQIKAQLSILEAKRTAINAQEADIFNVRVCGYEDTHNSIHIRKRGKRPC